MEMETQLNSSVGSEEYRGELYEGNACGLWARRLTSTVEYRPRQFEYHPTIPGRMVIGTLEGEVIVTDVGRDVAVSVLDDCLSLGSGDAILGLCWLKTHPTKFAAGASSGKMNICNIREDGIPNILHTYLHHGKTTSVHLNCTDEYLLSSGYSDNASIIFVETGQLVHKFSGIHHGHINISRFSNLNPNIFATCSFDCTAKMWDIRDPYHLKCPIYTCQSDSGHVMLCFSPDDVFLLTSAIDNEVTQYLAVDGQKHLKLNIPSTEKYDNFTRAYYTADSQHILSGSSDQPEIRVHSTQTGDLVSCIEMYPGRQHNSIFIQSLRGDPHCCSRLSVLVNYKELCYPLEIIHVDLGKHDESIVDKEPLGVRTDLGGLNTQDCLAIAAIPLSGSVEEEDKGGYYLHSLPSRQLPLDLWGEDNTRFADCVVVCEGGTELKAHLALLSVRCPALFKNCNFSDHCNETNLKQCQLPVPQAQELGHPFCDGSRLPPSHTHHHSSRYSQNSGNNTSTGALVQVFPPESVHSTVIQIVLRYLYTDELHEESAKLIARDIEVGDEFGYLLDLSPEDANRMQLITVYERIYLASNVFLLSRLASLVEVKLRDMVDVVSVIRLAEFSSRVGTSQLLSYCISFISIHLEVILRLHANESLPSGLLEEAVSFREVSTYQVDTCLNCEVDFRFMGAREPIPPTLCKCSSISSSMTSIPIQKQTSSCKRRHPRCNRALIRYLTSPLTGHTSTAMFSQGESILCLGGGAQSNKKSYSHISHVLMLEGIGSALKSVALTPNQFSEDYAEAVWTKHISRGSPPSTLAYHSATPLEPFDQYRRWVLVFGGSIDLLEALKNGESTIPQTWVLDVLTMTWTCENPKGNVPSHRTRHTMVAMYPKHAAGEGGGVPTEDPSFAYSSKTTKYAQLVLFGGYSTTNSRVFNDVHFLHVSHKESSKVQRKRDSSVHSPISSVENFNFVLSRPEVTGTPPSPRLAHAACMVKNRFMVVFGGMGLGNVFNDVHVLHIHSPTRLEWEIVEIKGAAPSPRYGHSVVAMQNDDGFTAESNAGLTSTLVVFGGTSGKLSFTDLYVLKMERIEELEKWEMTWFLVEVGMIGSVVDTPYCRYKQTLCDVGGKFIIYGGSDQKCLQDYSQQGGKNSDMGTSVYMLMPDSTTYRCVVFQSDDGSLAVTRKVLYWELRKIHTAVVVSAPEPPVLIKPSSFRSDLQQLFSSGVFSDVVLSSGNEDDVETQRFPAHRFILSSRCGPLGMMFNSTMKETKSGRVLLKDTSPSVLEALLTYLYTDTLDLHFPDLMNLLLTARKYMLNKLEALCRGRLQMMLFSKSFNDLPSSIQLFECSEALHLNDLRGLVFHFLLRKWEEIRRVKEYTELPMTPWHELYR